MTSVFNIRLKNGVNNTGKAHQRTPGWKGTVRSNLPWSKAGRREGKNGNIRYFSSGRADPVPVDAGGGGHGALSLGVTSQTLQRLPLPEHSLPWALSPAFGTGGTDWAMPGGSQPLPLPCCFCWAGWAQPQVGFAPSPPQISPSQAPTGIVPVSVDPPSSYHTLSRTGNCF